MANNIVIAHQRSNNGNAPAAPFGLPTEMVEKILGLLDPKTLGRASMVTKLFNHFTSLSPFAQIIDGGARAFRRWVVDPQDPMLMQLVDGHNRVFSTRRFPTHV